VLKKFYLGFGAVLIGGYLGWSLLGLELPGHVRDPDPTIYQAHSTARRTGTGFWRIGRSRGMHFGTGFGFGK